MRVWCECPSVRAASDRGDHGQAVRIALALETRARELGDFRNAAYARVTLSWALRLQGDYDQSYALALESLADFQDSEDLEGVGWALHALSDVACDRGDPAAVTRLCEQALTQFREAGTEMRPWGDLLNLGVAARIQGNYLRAEVLLEESLSVLRGRGWPRATAEVLANVGLLALEQGRYQRAQQVFAESLRIARTWIDGTAVEGLASVAIAQGQADRSARLFGAADSIRASLGTPRFPANEALYQRHVSLAHHALGKDRFTQVWEEGRAMTSEQAIAYALNDVAGSLST